MARPAPVRVASACGRVGALLHAAACATAIWQFVRFALRGGLSYRCFATVGVFGREISLTSVNSLGVYISLFSGYPAFLLATLLWRFFAALPSRRDEGLAGGVSPYVCIAAVVGLSDAATLVATGLHGEAGALATAADAAMFAVFLVHRFAMAAFFLLASRRGPSSLPAAAWLLPLGWSLAVAGVAACRLAQPTWTQADAPAALHLLAGTALAAAFALAATSTLKGKNENAPSK